MDFAAEPAAPAVVAPEKTERPPRAGAAGLKSNPTGYRDAEARAGSPGLRTLLAFYDELHRALGPQHWWPGRTRFEVIVGAILTQSTAWTNVERAIRNLRRARLLTPRALERVSQKRLERLVRPAGYFRQKARKLKTFLRFLRENFSGSLGRMLRTPTQELRERLLAVHGIGRETADSILLYAGNHRVFVVDAYTRRILERHGLIGPKAGYEEIRALFERNLPRDARLWNEYHALLVAVGKNWCRRVNPRCDTCPLGRFLESRTPVVTGLQKREPRP
jgi:endonuclease-3 related protein